MFDAIAIFASARSLGRARDPDRARGRARHRQSDLHLDPVEQAAARRIAAKARRIGISLALILRLVLLSAIAWLVGLTAPVFDLGLHGAAGRPWRAGLRDRLLLARPDPDRRRPVPGLEGDQGDPPQCRSRPGGRRVRHVEGRRSRFGAAIVQILLLDLVFSIDSILTAVGMTEHLAIMVVAVLVAVGGDAARRRSARQFHRQQPDRGDAGAGLPADDRRGADRRRLRHPCAQGLYLRGDGLFGPGRGAQHVGAPGAGAPAGGEGRAPE